LAGGGLGGGRGIPARHAATDGDRTVLRCTVRRVTCGVVLPRDGSAGGQACRRLRAGHPPLWGECQCGRTPFLSTVCVHMLPAIGKAGVGNMFPLFIISLKPWLAMSAWRQVVLGGGPQQRVGQAIGGAVTWSDILQWHSGKPPLPPHPPPFPLPSLPPHLTLMSVPPCLRLLEPCLRLL
jgi:hypothetical protein